MTNANDGEPAQQANNDVADIATQQLTSAIAAATDNPDAQRRLILTLADTLITVAQTLRAMH